MVRYAKKNSQDGTETEDVKLHRSQRKYRGQKVMPMASSDRQDRRHGWGYGKRKTVLAD